VVLSADGGDELFSGYSNYTSMLKLLATRERIPKPLRALLTAVLKMLPLDSVDALLLAVPLPSVLRGWLRHRVIRRARLARDFHLSGGTSGELYQTSTSAYWRGRDVGALLGTPDNQTRELADIYPGTFAEQMCLWDLHNYLPGDILAKVDRAAMAVSIEGREPLIDHRIAEFAFRLPLNLRRGALGSKHLLRKVLYKYVPRELVDRPKMGFGIPLQEWLQGDLAYLIDEYLDPKSVREQGILNPIVVEKVVHAFRAGDGEVTNKLWSLLAFQMWRKRWV
jgi:asparagine synthase (glutamine-hydrolysing)